MGANVYDKGHMLKLSGGSLCVYESGNPALPPVLLLHGAMYDEARLSWHNLAPFLSEFRHVYALDFPRHGQSRPWTGFIGQKLLVELIDDVIEFFGLPPLPLIGLSMGGAVSLGYSLSRPDRVTGLMLIAPGGLGDKIDRQFVSWLVIKTPGVIKYLTRYYGNLSLNNMRKVMLKVLHEGERTKDFEDILALTVEEAKKKLQYNEASMDGWQLESLAPFRLKLNLLPQLHSIKCPVLFLRGENDTLVSQPVIDEAVSLIPNSELKIIENAGHLLPLEQPDLVNRAALEFLMNHNI